MPIYNRIIDPPALSSDLSEVRSTISDLETILASHGTSINNNNTSISTLQGSVSSLQTSVATATTTNNTQDTSITSLQSGLSTTNTNVNSLSSSLTTTNGNVTNLTTSLGTTNSSLSSLTTTVSGHTTSISTINDSITSINGINTTQDSNISTLQTNMTTAQGDISSLKTKLTLTGDIQYNSGGALTGSNLKTDGNSLTVPTTLTVPTINASAGTLDVAVAANSIINLGSSTSTVNIPGTTVTTATSNLAVTNKTIVVNDGGAASSSSGAGLDINENSTITGYIHVSSNRDCFDMKSPNGPLFKTPTAYSSTDSGKFLTVDGSNATSWASITLPTAVGGSGALQYANGTAFTGSSNLTADSSGNLQANKYSSTGGQIFLNTGASTTVDSSASSGMLVNNKGNSAAGWCALTPDSKCWGLLAPYGGYEFRTPRSKGTTGDFIQFDSTGDCVWTKDLTGTKATTFNSDKITSIGTSLTLDSDNVDIGRSGQSINFTGNIASDVNLIKQLLTLNKGGVASSAGTVGLQCEEGGVITGQMVLDSKRTKLQAPGGAMFATPDTIVTNGFLTTDASGNTSWTSSSGYIQKDSNGIVASKLIIQSPDSGQVSLSNTVDQKETSAYFYKWADRTIRTNLSADVCALGLNIGAVGSDIFGLYMSSRPVWLIDGSNGNMTVCGDTAPACALDVRGQIKSDCGYFPKANGGAGQILVADGSGNNVWSGGLLSFNMTQSVTPASTGPTTYQSVNFDGGSGDSVLDKRYFKGDTASYFENVSSRKIKVRVYLTMTCSQSFQWYITTIENSTHVTKSQGEIYVPGGWNNLTSTASDVFYLAPYDLFYIQLLLTAMVPYTVSMRVEYE